MEKKNSQPRNTRYASVLAAQPVGITAELVTIEADLSRGLHAFSIIGLPDKAVEEARDRISSAIRHAGFPPPKATNRRIVLSFSPADLRKEGSHYDVPLALAYLAAAGELKLPNEPAVYCGELALDGSVRAVRGVLSQVIAARRAGIRRVYVPEGNREEALLAPGIDIYAIGSLIELAEHFRGIRTLHPAQQSEEKEKGVRLDVDIRNIKGQESAKRALEIAAAGKHNIVLYGPPGTGKTLLARSLAGILPPLTPDEMLDATMINSLAGNLERGRAVRTPPFRAPHHTISPTALVGGGTPPHPGEITLACHGVLFLDELTEFTNRSLESLRQPLEDRVITISRGHTTYTFPADCMIVTAFNPADMDSKDDVTTVRAMNQQRHKISRPIADRFDIWIEVPKLSHDELLSQGEGEGSHEMQQRVSRARELSQTRVPGHTNATIPFSFLEEIARCEPAANTLLIEAADRLKLSPRAYHRTLRVARTIADLAQSETIKTEAVLEALQYRPRGLLGLD